MIEPEVQEWLSYEAETERLRAETDRLRGIVQRYENAEAEVMREVELPTRRATDTDQREQLMAEAAEIVSLVCRKGGGYGDSFRSPTGALADTLFENSTRLHQKAMRLYWLTRAWSRDEAFDEDGESVEDTLRDLAGYCLLLLTEMGARHGE